jgi:flagellar hook-length control protein FliK
VATIIGIIAPLINPPAPPASSPAKTATPMAITTQLNLSAIDDPIIDLLKQLLPVDSPVGSMLERFRQTVMALTTAPTSNDAIGKMLTLLNALPVDLKTVTGEQLGAMIDRLGLRYEPMLQAAFAQRVPFSVPQLTAQNLKAALLTIVEAPLPDVAVNTLSQPTPPGSNSASPGISSGSGNQPQPHATDMATPALPGSFAHQPEENLETALLKQLQAQSKAMLMTQAEPMSGEAEALQQGTTSQPSGTAVQQRSALRQHAETLLGTDGLEQILMRVNPEGSQETESALLRLFRSLPETMQIGTDMDHSASPLKTAGTGQDLQQLINSLKTSGSEPPDPLAVEQLRKLVVTKLVAADPEELAASDSAPAGLSASVTGTGVRQQAHELLAAIERTQVLNSVNNERGEPLSFQIPILLDGRLSTAEFYVKRRLESAPNTDPEERHYSVVALLDLSELGALRVDLAMHKQQLSIKVTVESVETEALANRLLPELGQALGQQGFAVEFLKCEQKTDGSARGEELREQTLPENRLINLRA